MEHITPFELNENLFSLLDKEWMLITARDPETKRIASDVLKEYLSERAVLVITHDGEECELLGGKSVEFSSLLTLNTEI